MLHIIHVTYNESDAMVTTTVAQCCQEQRSDVTRLHRWLLQRQISCVRLSSRRNMTSHLSTFPLWMTGLQPR